MKNRRLLRKGSSVMLAFLLSLSLWAIFIMGGCLNGIVRDSALLRALDDSNYYEKSYEAFCEQADVLLEEAGLAKTALQTALPLRKFYIDEKQCMQSMLKEQDISISEEQIKEEVASGIFSYYEEKGITITSEQNVTITQTADILANEYTKWMKLDFLKSISDYWKEIKTKLVFAMPVCIILIGLIIFALCNMYQYKHKALRYVASGILGASALTAVSVFLLKRVTVYADLISEPVYYQDFITEYFESGIHVMGYQIIFGGVLFLIVIGIIYAMRKSVTGE